MGLPNLLGSLFFEMLKKMPCFGRKLIFYQKKSSYMKDYLYLCVNKLEYGRIFRKFRKI
jgi:hypothetical protein